MKLSKSTLAEQIYDILKSDIMEKRIKPGDKLTLQALQDRFEVSSTPIRQALTRLVEDDLMVYYSNIGIKVNEMGAEDIKEIFTFTSDLDAIALKYSFNGTERDKTIEDLENNLHLMKIATNENKPKLWEECSDSFHLVFYDHCQNQRLINASEKMRGQLTICATDYESDPQNQIHIAEDHNNIYMAYKDGNCDLAERLMREHLLRSLEYALKIFE